MKLSSFFGHYHLLWIACLWSSQQQHHQHHSSSFFFVQGQDNSGGATLDFGTTNNDTSSASSTPNTTTPGNENGNTTTTLSPTATPATTTTPPNATIAPEPTGDNSNKPTDAPTLTSPGGDNTTTSTNNETTTTAEEHPNQNDMTNIDGQTFEGMTLRELIISREDLTLFRDFLDQAGLLETLLDDESQQLTVFAPDDFAMQNNRNIQLYSHGMEETPPRWYQTMLATCKNHIVENTILDFDQIFDQVRTEIVSMQDTWQVAQFSQTVGGAQMETANLMASNGILHITRAVIAPQFFTQTFAQLELQEEFGPDHLNRISMVDVVDNIPGARQVLSESRDTGLTYAGCRIRAFNRMGLDYLPQTINGGQFVKENELMNASFAKESLHNFVEYQLIPHNYYYPDIEKNFEQLVMPINRCSHIWITNRFGTLCFNDACIVSTPDPRWFLASNGVGYVLDKCIICSGIAMLTDYAAEYSSLNTKDAAQLFWGTEWNLRNLSSAVGDGGPLTLFASINTGFNFFTLEDTTRLSTDKWRRHLWDLTKHFLTQGIYTKDKLMNMTKTNGGPWNLTMLTGENVTIDVDDARQMVLVDGGDLFMHDMQGQDGLLHFTTQVPQPRSVTKNCFTIVEDDPQERFKLHLGYLTSMFLEEDVKRLLPLTVFYAPNEVWEGVLIDLMELSETVLENMIFKELLWCEKLVEMANARQPIESHNGQLWNVVVNEDGYPCIRTAQQKSGDVTMDACITKCDILARNGLVHEIDSLIVYQSLESLAPFPPVAPVPPSAPTPLFQQPIERENMTAPTTVTPSSSAWQMTTSHMTGGFLSTIGVIWWLLDGW